MATAIHYETRLTTDDRETKITADCDSPAELEKIIDCCRGNPARKKIFGIF